MRYSYVCGIDISKHHLDLSLVKGAGPQLFSGRCTNVPNELEALFNELPLDDLSSVLFCAENTGMYGYLLQQIAGNQELARQNRLLQSIPGVGPRVALAAMILTKGFTCFDNARAFCCYCGVAPFVWHSGTETNTKARVSLPAEKRMKSLLHMGAMTAVKRPGELKMYYERKCEEGKPKMSALNAVRSKLIHRMFAVIKHYRMYQPKLLTIA